MEMKGGRVSRDVLARLTMLVTHRTIANLPEEWPEEVEADESGLETFGEQKRFALTVAALRFTSNTAKRADISNYRPGSSPWMRGGKRRSKSSSSTSSCSSCWSRSGIRRLMCSRIW